MQNQKIRIEAAIDCLRAGSVGMISVECRHTIFNSYLQTQDRKYNSPSIRLSEPLNLLCETVGLRGTQFEKHCPYDSDPRSGVEGIRHATEG
jgi:hypothetical protein